MSVWNLNELECRTIKGRKRYTVAATGVEFFHPKKTKYFERPLAFLDLETSGFDPRHSSILEIAIIRSDRDVPLVRKLPLQGGSNTQEALEIVGYDPEEWKDAVPWGDVAQDVWDWLAEDSPAIVGHNVIRFDWAFLEWRLRSLGFPTQLVGRPFIDTMQLAFRKWHDAKAPYRPEGLGLNDVCVYLGLEPEGIHRALGGATRARQIYERINS